jgi:hypothetical protein
VLAAVAVGSQRHIQVIWNQSRADAGALLSHQPLDGRLIDLVSRASPSTKPHSDLVGDTDLK